MKCPYCERNFHQCTYPLHVDACPRHPDNDDVVRTALADPNNPGYALGRRRYDRVAQRISARTLTREFGTWEAVCAHYGLMPCRTKPPKRDRAAETKRRVNPMNAPLTDAERHACKRRGMVEDAAIGGVHSHLRSVVAR